MFLYQLLRPEHTHAIEFDKKPLKVMMFFLFVNFVRFVSIIQSCTISNCMDFRHGQSKQKVLIYRYRKSQVSENLKSQVSINP